MSVAYIGLGSNLGKREDNLQTALKKIRKAGIKVLKTSSFMETKPYGIVDQPFFDFRSGHKNMIEFAASLVESDCPITGTVAGMYHLERLELVTALQDQRRLLSDHEQVERAEEV